MDAKCEPPPDTPAGTVCLLRAPVYKLSLPPQPVFVRWTWLGNAWAMGDGNYPVQPGMAHLLGYRFHGVADPAGEAAPRRRTLPRWWVRAALNPPTFGKTANSSRPRMAHFWPSRALKRAVLSEKRLTGEGESGYDGARKDCPSHPK